MMEHLATPTSKETPKSLETFKGNRDMFLWSRQATDVEAMMFPTADAACLSLTVLGVLQGRGAARGARGQGPTLPCARWPGGGPAFCPLQHLLEAWWLCTTSPNTGTVVQYFDHFHLLQLIIQRKNNDTIHTLAKSFVCDSSTYIATHPLWR